MRRLAMPPVGLIVLMLVAAGCGDDDVSEPDPSASGDFTTAVAEICTGFYAQVIGLQGDLQAVLSEDASPADQERGLAIVDEIQAASAGFLADLEAAPDPDTEAAQDQADALLTSVEAFLAVQDELLTQVRSEISGDEQAALSPADVENAQTELNAELNEQQTLLRELGIPECLPG